MTHLRHFQRAATCVLVAGYLAGCAAPNGGSRQVAGSDNEDPCSVGNSALLGGFLGALAGGVIAGKDGAVKGAMLGGAAGAVSCVAINMNSKQTKTAAQADLDYRRTRGAQPREPVVVSYVPKLSSSKVQRGQPLTVTSELELVNGTAQPIKDVKEELVVFNPDGTPFKTGSKPFTANSGGHFVNSFELTLPSSSPQGVYALKTNLYVNGKLTTTRDLNTQLAWNGNTGVLVASR